MKKIAKIAVPLVIQLAVAWVLAVFVLAPLVGGRPFPWQDAAADGAAEAHAEDGEGAHAESGEHGHDEDPPALGPLLPLDGILVNVAETQGRRYFKTSITLEMAGEAKESKHGGGGAVDHLPMPVLRGAILDVLSAKTLDQLIQPTARDSLKTEILESLNAEVGPGTFHDLFFTEFLVQ
ncbi:MAG: flagellar basal body-associated FliL family protein [Candidatus Eiseniibacteriota bacterium]